MGVVRTFYFHFIHFIHIHFIHFILVNFYSELVLLRKLKKYRYKRRLGGEGQNFWNSVKLGKTSPQKSDGKTGQIPSQDWKSTTAIQQIEKYLFKKNHRASS